MRLANEIRELQSALTLHLNPSPGTLMRPEGPEIELQTRETRPTKYVFAICGCRDHRGRTQPIRVARGRWQVQSICCHICSQWFRDPEEESHPLAVNTLMAAMGRVGVGKACGASVDVELDEEIGGS
jgi:hypothetical protein